MTTELAQRTEPRHANVSHVGVEATDHHERGTERMRIKQKHAASATKKGANSHLKSAAENPPIRDDQTAALMGDPKQ